MATKKKTPQTSKPITGSYLTFKPESLDDIQAVQIRFDVTDSDVESLAAQIARQGQLSPAVCRPLASGCHQLISGNTRLRAIRRINANLSKYGLEKPLPLKYVLEPIPDGDVALAAWSSNTQGAVSLMDTAHGISRLHATGWTVEQLANELPHAGPLKLNRANIEWCIKVATTLPGPIHQLIHQKILNRSTVAQLLRVAKKFELPDDDIVSFAECVSARETFSVLVGDISSRKTMTAEAIKGLITAIVEAGLREEQVSCKTIKALCDGKPLGESASDEESDDSAKRTLADLVQLCKVASSEPAKVLLKWIEGNGEDVDVIKNVLGRNVVEDNEQEKG